MIIIISPSTTNIAEDVRFAGKATPILKVYDLLVTLKLRISQDSMQTSRSSWLRFFFHSNAKCTI